jgi:predicted HicB family RNase H-like nuclease
MPEKPPRRRLPQKNRVIAISEDLHRKLKRKALERGVFMQEMVEQKLSELVQKPKTKNPQTRKPAISNPTSLS